MYYNYNLFVVQCIISLDVASILDRVYIVHLPYRFLNSLNKATNSTQYKQRHQVIYLFFAFCFPWQYPSGRATWRCTMADLDGPFSRPCSTYLGSFHHMLIPTTWRFPITLLWGIPCLLTFKLFFLGLLLLLIKDLRKVTRERYVFESLPVWNCFYIICLYPVDCA